MRIIFDIWVFNKPCEYSFEEERLLEVIYSFVEDRIMVLQSQVDAEENSPGNENACIMIELKLKRISFLGYSDELIEKLKSCFTAEDSQILSLRLSEAFNYMN